MLREGAFLVAQVTVGHAQGRPIKVASVGVREMNGHVALTRYNRYDCHLSVQADSDGSSFLSVLKFRQQSPLQCFVGIILIVHLLGEDLHLWRGLLVFGVFPSVCLLLQQSQNGLQHASDPFAVGGRALARHLQVVEIIVELVLVVEHVVHCGGGHLASRPLLILNTEPVLKRSASVRPCVHSRDSE